MVLISLSSMLHEEERVHRRRRGIGATSCATTHLLGRAVERRCLFAASKGRAAVTLAWLCIAALVVIGAFGWAVGGGGRWAVRWSALCLAVSLVIGLYVAAIAARAVNSPGSRAYLPIGVIVFAGLYAPALVTAWRAESPASHRLRFFSAGGLLVAVVVIAVELDQSSVHQPWGRPVQVGVILLPSLLC
jgi:hypothetical protein